MAEETHSTLEARNQKIMDQLRAGKSLREVGEEFGLSGEGVRQIAVKYSEDDFRQVRNKALRERRRNEGLNKVRVLAEEDQGATVATIAKHAGGGVTADMVRDILGEREALRRDQTRFRENATVQNRFSDEECVNALQRVSRKLAPEGQEFGSVTMKSYGANFVAGEPGKNTIQKRFGSWSQACKNAGVPDGSPKNKRHYGRLWTNKEMTGIARKFFADCGVFGSMSQYAEWAAHQNEGVEDSKDRVPTTATMRAHFGSWTEMKRIAEKMAHSKK